MFQDYKAPKMTREQRKANMHAKLRGVGRAGITATQLIRLTGLRRNPYSLSILEDLVREGNAVWENSALTNGLPVRVYWDRDNYDQMIQDYMDREGSNDMTPEDLPF